MNWIPAQTMFLDTTQGMVGFAANWLLQSTMLIVVGIVTARLLQHRGSAVQSAVYRTTLVAVLVCPLASGLLSLGNFSGWSIQMPAVWSFQPSESELLANANSSPNDVVLSAGPRFPAKGFPTSGNGFKPTFSAGGTLPVSPLNLPKSIAPESSSIAKSALPMPESFPVARNEELMGNSGLASQRALTVRPFGFAVIAVCGLWLVTSSVLLFRLALAWWRINLLRQRAVCADEPTMQTCRDLAAQLHVVAPAVLQSPYFPSPCLTGLRRPAILLPDSDVRLPVRDVLVHELAHLRRHDCHWSLLSRVTSTVFFFQPLLWQLIRRLEAAAEEVCDDYVVQLGGNRQEYAHRLVDIAELSYAPIAAAGVGIVSLRTMLAIRVSRIMDTSRSLSTRIGNLLLTLVLVGGLAGTLAAGFVGAGSRHASDEATAQPAAQQVSSDNEPLAGEQRLGNQETKDKPVTEAAQANKEKTSSNVPKEKPAVARELQCLVLSDDGKPVAGAKLYWFRTRVHDLKHMQPRLLATSTAEGLLKFTVPNEYGRDPNEPAAWSYTDYLVIRAAGHGFATPSANLFASEARQQSGTLGTIVEAFKRALPLTINLPRAGEPIRGRLVNIDGQAIAGATVRIRWFDEIEPLKRLQYDGKTLDRKTAIQKKAADLLNTIEPVPFREVLPMATTDANGRFEILDVGENRLFQLLVQGERIESTNLLIHNQPGEAIALDPDPHSDQKVRTIFAREFLHAIGPSKPVAGQVANLDTGKPIADAVVRVYAIHGLRIHSSRDREEFATRTGPDGRYQITGLPIGPENGLVAFTTSDVPYLPAGYTVDTSKGDITERNFQLKEGVWAEGRVFDAETEKPFVGEVSYYYFRNPKLEKEVTGLFRAFVDGRYWTNSRGEFRVPVLPSRGILTFDYRGDDRARDGIDRFPRGSGADSIEGEEDVGGLQSFKTLPHYLIPSNYDRVAEVRPAEGQKVVRVDMPLYSSKPIKIRPLDPDGKPVSGVIAYGINQRWGWQERREPEFIVEDLLPKERRKIFLFHRERNLAGGAIVDSSSKQPVDVTLQKSGTIKGRLLDGDGEPITPALVQADYEKLEKDDTAAIWADAPNVVANPQNIHVDKEGRFVLDGLIPGWTYNAYVSAHRKLNGEMMDRIIGSPFQGVTVAPGESKDLGDLVIDETKSDEENQTQAKEAPVKSARSSEIQGTVRDPDGKPVRGAHVAIIGMANEPMRGGDLQSRGEVLAESITSENGRYRLTLQGSSSKTHRYSNLIVRKDDAGISWEVVNLDDPKKEMDVLLSPDEPIRARLVDIEGQPADKVKVQIKALVKRSSDAENGVGYDGKRIPGAWLPPAVSDSQGRVTIRGVPPGYGTYLDIEGSERFAPQDIALNTGQSEQRGERDGTYRPLVKNVRQGEEAILPLAPAQLFEGTVRYEDNGEPVPHARLTIWASQQAEFGSMISVAGETDGQGKYRISPRPGIRFGVTAYAPEGQPYLIRQTTKPIAWEAGDRIKRVDMILPRGIVVRGKVINAGTGAGVADAAIQYVPEEANNSRASDTILTGWQGIQLSDQNGNFQIVVLDGPGWLITHSNSGNFVLQEVGSSQLSHGKAGGQRNYAHAFLKVNPKPNAEPLNVKIELQPGAKISGQIVDAHGKAVEETLVITRLAISPHALWWRGHTVPVLGGRFELSGLRDGLEYPTHFLDAKRQLGATAILKASDATPTVVLQPCGAVTMKFVNSQGEAVADHIPTVEMVVTPGSYRFDMKSMSAGKLAADSDFIANIDRFNHWRPRKSDATGKITLPGLIPGATYRVMVPREGRNHVSKEFQPKSGETIDLGALIIETAE